MPNPCIVADARSRVADVHFSMPTLPESTEQWKPVVGFEGLYEVSDLGRVKRLTAARGHKAGAIQKGTIGSHGYCLATLTKNGVSRDHLVHRLVAKAFLGPCGPKIEVNHIDGNRANPVLSNLEYTTRRENAQHAVRIGRIKTGEASPLSLFTNQEVRRIRQLKGTMSARKMSVSLGINYHTLVNILYRRVYPDAR